MRFSNIVKGNLTQSLTKLLFERAGYRVTRFGIEELFYEVVHLERSQYIGLGLPQRLRDLPDLLVATPDIDKAFLLEVKYRRRFDEQSASGLRSVLTKQFKHWPKTQCILMIGEAVPAGGRFHQDYIRVINKTNLDYLDTTRWRASSDDGPTSERDVLSVHGARGIWDLLPPLNRAFTLFRHDTTDAWSCADMITGTLNDLRKLDE